jgi:hypothetical protein
MGKSSPKKTFMEEHDRNQSPGPGYYESEHKKIGINSQKMTIGSRPKD